VAILAEVLAPAERTIDEEIEEFIPPSAEWAELQAASLRFITSPWLGRALMGGWDELELWGAFPTSRIEVVRRRSDCLGLAPALALGMGCSFESIDEHQAVMSRKRTGARLVHRRALPGRHYAVLWWTAPLAHTAGAA
jgi:hypothetical protein